MFEGLKLRKVISAWLNLGKTTRYHAYDVLVDKPFCTSLGTQGVQ